MADLLSLDDIRDLQDAVAPSLNDESVALIEVWRQPVATAADAPTAGGRGKDKYGFPVGDTPEPTAAGQQYQKVAQYPARINRAGVGNEGADELQAETVAPWTLVFNWADDPDIFGADHLVVAKSEVVNGVQTRLVRAALTPYSVGDIVQPTVSNGRAYRCKVAGTTGTREPLWPTPLPPRVYGATVTDGTVTWEYIEYLRSFEVVDPGGLGSYNVVRMVRCEEID